MISITGTKVGDMMMTKHECLGDRMARSWTLTSRRPEVISRSELGFVVSIDRESELVQIAFPTRILYVAAWDIRRAW